MPNASIPRHALAVLALPFTVTVLIPVWIGRTSDTVLTAPASPAAWLAVVTGALALAVGLLLLATCIGRFGSEGRGTLAPWDPPKELVVGGPYAWVRNPMISGVCLVLLGEGLVLRSAGHLAWAGIFFLANAAYIPLLEEPRLRRRFGRAYAEYEKAVPRLVPRLRPWRPERSGGGSTESP